MCYGKLAEAFDKTKEWDPITPNLIEEVFKRDSQMVEGLGRATGWDQLERDAQWNQDNPEEGIAHASVATGIGFLGAGLSNWLGGAGGAAGGAAGEAAGLTVEQAAQVAAQKAAEEAMRQEILSAAQYAMQETPGLLGQAPQGLANTMESGLLSTGYTPSSLWNAAKYGPESGQAFGETMGNWASNRATNAKHAMQNFGGSPAGKKYAVQQGLKMMSPKQQPAPPPYQPPQQPQQEPQTMYGGDGPMYAGNSGLLGMSMSEEEKRKLRAMGYLV